MKATLGILVCLFAVTSLGPLDEQFMYRLVNMRTHRRSGDMAIVKMFAVGYKRTGDIQPARTTNQNQTRVVVAAGGTMREVYKAKWLRDKEAALAAEFEAEASRRDSN